MTWGALASLCVLPSLAQETDTPPGYVDDVTNAGTSAAAFLQIGVGARVLPASDEPVSTHVKAAGLNTCCGGIVSMGETRRDR